MEPFTTAITEASGNVTSMGGALVGIAAVGVTFWLAIKFIKKIAKAA